MENFLLIAIVDNTIDHKLDAQTNKAVEYNKTH